jgi:photosystem II stability/assembly factor-like uncharacterized protein
MPPNVPHVKTIAFDPRDPNILLAGVEQGGLFRSQDGGESWFELDSYYTPQDEVYKDMHQVTRRPNHPNEIFMTSGNGFYASKDDGSSWTHLTDRHFRIGYPDKLIFSPHDDGLMFMCGAVANPGTWRVNHFAHPSVMASRDLGKTWEPMTRGLPEDMVPSIEAMSIYSTRSAQELFAGTTAGEVYYSSDGAESWRRICDGLGPVSKSTHFRLLMTQ